MVSPRPMHAERAREPTGRTRFRADVERLALGFAFAVLDAIWNAPMDELMPEARDGSRRGPPSLPPVPSAAVPRLRRRSPADIARVLAAVVDLLRRTPGGLRAEAIRKELGMDSRELPRVLREGVRQHALTATGQRRATTYMLP